ncbi:MAG: hypothetical protein EOP51_25070 [Sphingobacteriales bacterium]|nr:MAG: hypothetical protein EOP51_25070 [Sphingobacteriales bacterium]
MRRILLSAIISTIFFSANAYAQKWKNGHYYDTTFTKVSGLIQSKETYILFKKDKNADKIKILANDMNSYVAGTDSFIVSRMPEMAKIPIVKVLIDNPVKLYVAKQSAKFGWGSVLAGVAIGVGTGVATGVSIAPNIGGGSAAIYFLYGYGPDDLQPLTSQNFIKVMSGIMSDNPGILEKIKDRTANINNLEEWVNFYNKEKAAQPVAN